ncbi:MAG: hypothetical protein WAW61_22260 [Methylococcaceae bacterium]
MIETMMFFAQVAASLMSTLTLYAAINPSRLRYVATAALSDGIKLLIISGVAVESVQGNFAAILCAISGGMVGNFIAHSKKQSAVNEGMK